MRLEVKKYAMRLEVKKEKVYQWLIQQFGGEYMYDKTNNRIKGLAKCYGTEEVYLQDDFTISMADNNKSRAKEIRRFYDGLYLEDMKNR